MFTKSARFYDALYAWKDYETEAQRLRDLIQGHGHGDGATLLDVACGTGAHIAHLKQYYRVEGLDLDPVLLGIARERNPEIVFHQGDMADFKLGRQFDVVACLFSSIGYVKTVPRLNQTLANLARHAAPGGLVVVEPWLMPDAYEVGGVHALFVDQPELKIARMNLSALEGGVSILDFHYLVGTLGGIEHFTERHELGLFSHDDYLAAYHAAGLEVEYNPEGLMGRGLYVGVESQETRGVKWGK
jgi:SAM-dependent methyltransferase